MGGMRYESLADLPPAARQQVAAKMLAQKGGGSQEKPETRKSKYGNRKAEVNGISFDSQKEARRYEFLVAAENAGLIYDLRLQQDFTLQEAYTTPEGFRVRAIRYRADFTYKVAAKAIACGGAAEPFWRSVRSGELVVEDVKSRATKTKDYTIKRKMMADRGYIIREV